MPMASSDLPCFSIAWRAVVEDETALRADGEADPAFPGRQILALGQKKGADFLAGHDFVDDVGPGAVGDDHALTYPAMLAAVESGDPYLAFAIMAGLAPEGATKQSHADT